MYVVEYVACGLLCHGVSIHQGACSQSGHDKQQESRATVRMAENSNALPTFDAWIESSKATPVGSVLRSFQKALPQPLLRMTRSLKRGPSLHIPSPRECTTAGVVREKMSFDFQVQQELPAHSIDLFQDHATGSSSQDAVKHSELVSFPYGGDSLESPSCLLYTSPSPRDRTRSRMPSSA